MASLLRLAARKICGRTFQRPQQYFTAAVKGEQRRLFPSTISHGRSSLRRFSSSGSPKLFNNNKHGPNSAAGAAEASRRSNNTESIAPPLWSARSKKFLPLAWVCTVALSATCYTTIYVKTRGSGEWKEHDDTRKSRNDPRSDVYIL